MVFYAYLWLRDDGTPYYAGKGSGRRAFTSKGHSIHRPIQQDRILLFMRPTEAEAFATERELIGNWGRKDLGTGCLQNLTDGGDGPSGHIHSQRQKNQISRSLEGNQRARGKHWTLSPETKARMASHPANFIPLGVKRSAATRAKMSVAQKARFVAERLTKTSNS